MEHLNAGLIFSPEVKKVKKYVKKYVGRAKGAGEHEFWYNSSMFYSDITDYFWLSTFSNLSVTS